MTNAAQAALFIGTVAMGATGIVLAKYDADRERKRADGVCSLIKQRAKTTARDLINPGTMSRVELAERALDLGDLVAACIDGSTFDFARFAECRSVENHECVAGVLDSAASRIK